MKKPDDALTAAWTTPARTNPLIRKQAAATMRDFSKRHTLAAAARFKEFTKPVLILWAREDKFFTVGDAERLAADFPDGRLVLLDDCYSFLSLDQPERTADEIAGFVREPRATAPGPVSA
jgi:pimeloyl-ACP methyl ester carboxylesterase